MRQMWTCNRGPQIQDFMYCIDLISHFTVNTTLIIFNLVKKLAINSRNQFCCLQLWNYKSKWNNLYPSVAPKVNISFWRASVHHSFKIDARLRYDFFPFGVWMNSVTSSVLQKQAINVSKFSSTVTISWSWK